MSHPLDPLAAEILALGRAAREARGEDDLRVLRRLKALSYGIELGGRALLQFAAGPFAWFFGMAGVAFHLALEAQLNHAIMHGAYDGLEGAGRYTSDRYETLANPFQSKTWRDAHRIHHATPSLLGEDPDTVHPFFRVHAESPWRPWHALNGWLGTIFVFELWAFDYDHFLKARHVRPAGDRGELKKFALYLAFHFVLFPVLAGARWKEVLAAALVATIVRNVIFVALQTGSSVGHNVSTRHPRAYGRKRPGEWVRFQVETSKNFQLTPVWETLCGGLDRHIEHHLFPSLPARRLHMLSPRVRELCEKNGLRYEHHRSIWATLSDSIRYLGGLSRP